MGWLDRLFTSGQSDNLVPPAAAASGTQSAALVQGQADAAGVGGNVNTARLEQDMGTFGGEVKRATRGLFNTLAPLFGTTPEALPQTPKPAFVGNPYEKTPGDKTLTYDPATALWSARGTPEPVVEPQAPIQTETPAEPAMPETPAAEAAGTAPAAAPATARLAPTPEFDEFRPAKQGQVVYTPAYERAFGSVSEQRNAFTAEQNAQARTAIDAFQAQTNADQVAAQTAEAALKADVYGRLTEAEKKQLVTGKAGKYKMEQVPADVASGSPGGSWMIDEATGSREFLANSPAVVDPAKWLKESGISDATGVGKAMQEGKIDRTTAKYLLATQFGMK